VLLFVNVPEPEMTREQRRNATEEEWVRRLLSLVEGDAGPAAELIRTGRLELAGDNTYDLGRRRAVAKGASLALDDAVLLRQAA
jgi:hypothetical protein